MSRIKSLLLPVVLTVCIAFLESCGGGSATIMKSGWSTAPRNIDGNESDWGGKFAFIEKEKISLGIVNDAEYLYLCLKFPERPAQMQVMRQGLTIWIDSTGGDNKRWGIHYPIGMRGMGMEAGWQRGQEGAGEPDSTRFQNMRQQFYSMLREAAIVGSDGKEIERIPNTGRYGIEMAVSDSTGQLVYELRIPMHNQPGGDFAVNASPGSSVGIGLESGQFQRPSNMSRPEGSEGGFGGGRGGMGRGGGRRGGMGGGRGGGMDGNRYGSARPDPINVWTKITLAQPNATN